MNEPNELNPEQVQRLTSLAEDAERELALGVQSQSSRAFNLGCALWFFPGAIAVSLAFLLSDGNWVIAFFMAVLVSLIAVGFALVSANNTKNKSINRLYLDRTLPQLSKDLAESNLSQSAFQQIALQVLPTDALLRQLLGKQAPGDGLDQKTDDRNLIE